MTTNRRATSARLSATAGLVIGGAWLVFGAIDGFDRPARAVGAAAGALVGAVIQVAAFRAMSGSPRESPDSQVEFLRGVLRAFLLRVVAAGLLAAVVLAVVRQDAIPFLIGLGAQYAVLEVVIDVGLVRAANARERRD